KAGRTDLGRGSDVYVADGDRQTTGGRQIQPGSGGSGADDAGTLGGRRAYEQSVVCGRLEERACERDADPAVCELQPSRPLVLGQLSDSDGQLGRTEGG